MKHMSRKVLDEHELMVHSRRCTQLAGTVMIRICPLETNGWGVLLHVTKALLIILVDYSRCICALSPPLNSVLVAEASFSVGLHVSGSINLIEYIDLYLGYILRELCLRCRSRFQIDGSIST